MSALKSWQRATVIVVLAGLAVALLAWIARTDPAINYLPRHRDADWIVFPAAVDARAHWYASIDATFRREFNLPHKPAAARLSLRALRRAEVKVNGKSCGVTWSPPFRVDITKAVKPGANELEVEVVNFWPNRIIGDDALPKEQRLTRTNIRKLTKDSKLTESGLLGPVRLLQRQ